VVGLRTQDVNKHRRRRKRPASSFPTFCRPAQRTGDLKMPDVIRGEQLNLICGSIPKTIDRKREVKLTCLKNFTRYASTKTTYDAELEASGSRQGRRPRRSVIAAYGHDDRFARTQTCGLFNMGATPTKRGVFWRQRGDRSYGQPHGISFFITPCPNNRRLRKRFRIRVRTTVNFSALSTDVSGASTEFKKSRDNNAR